MKKLLVPVLCAYTALILAACSAPDDGEEGAIEQFTDEVARDATEAIHTPLDRARGVQDIARQRNEQFPGEETSEEEEW
jgi:hypothetical protein